MGWKLQNDELFAAVISSYLLSIVSNFVSKQLKSKMTPSNILKIKKGISVVLMVLDWF
jgi:hypothetical protein